MKIMSMYVETLAVQMGDVWSYPTQTEMKVLVAIAKGRKRLSTRAEIKKAVWPRSRIGRDTIDQFVKKLREKVGAETIRTIHARGYAISQGVAVSVYRT